MYPIGKLIGGIREKNRKNRDSAPLLTKENALNALQCLKQISPQRRKERREKLKTGVRIKNKREKTVN